MHSPLVSLSALILVASGLLLPAVASANTPITHYSALPSTVQAAGHPDLEISFAVSNRDDQGNPNPCNCEDAKDAIIHLPTGFVGNPHSTPQCTLAEFSADNCPIDSQVGIASVYPSGGLHFDSAVYNLVPPPDQAGLLAFKVFFFNTPQFTVLSARTGSDYGLDATVTSIYHGLFPLETFQQVLWGVPADPSHDPLRIDSRFNINGKGTTAFLGALRCK